MAVDDDLLLRSIFRKQREQGDFNMLAFLALTRAHVGRRKKVLLLTLLAFAALC